MDRLVGTYLNAFFMLIANIAMKVWNLITYEQLEEM